MQLSVHAFLSSALDKAEWLASLLGLFTPGERAAQFPDLANVWNTDLVLALQSK
jgi:hypothetical protein